MEILQNGISYFLCAKLSQAEICTCGDFSLARPHHFEEMPMWWNGIHSGLRNRGGSMRVQVSPQVLCAYIRIGIGAALRMQSGNRWRFESSYAHYAGLVELVYTAASNTAGESHKGSNPLSCIYALVAE